VALLAILLAALGLGGDPRHPTCFNARLWSAADRSRPCAEITRVEEDGSFRALVTTADGRVVYRTGVGNPLR
jgi:hypothetical protein